MPLRAAGPAAFMMPMIASFRPAHLRSATRGLLAAAALVALWVPTPAAWAQYKVVQPDGSVTYTDRPPTDGSARVTALGRSTGAPAADVGLPAELRQPTQRYPVTLFTSADCSACDSGRRLLQLRGIPYNERRVASEDDVQALERAVGARTVPALTIGAQALRGLSETDWAAYLDAAGYPRESRLPRNWPVPVATPLVERSAPVPVRAATTPDEPRPAVGGEATPGALRF
jgi:glutaredoxin